MRALNKLAFLASATMLVASNSIAAQAAPSASDVVARYVQAIGGRDAIMKMTSYKQLGTLSMPAMGLNAAMETNAAAPAKLSSKMSLDGIGEVLTGTDGMVAWSVNPMQGPRVLEAKELQDTKDGADFYGNLLFPADRYASIENLGVVDFNGEKAYKLKFVRKTSNRESTTYFSVASGLAVGAEAVQETPMGTTAMSVKMSDYKDFGGVKFPTKSEMTVGANSVVTVVNEVIVNGAPATAFEVPEAIKPLIKK